MNKKIIIIVLILILTTSAFSGCVDDSKETNDEKQGTDGNGDTEKSYTTNTNYPRDSLGLNEKGEKAFSAAIARYTEIKESMSAEDARTALVDELNNGFDNIKEASLSDDGYTIGLVFEDDTAALLFTYNGFHDNNTDAVTSSQFSSIKNIKKPSENSNQNILTMTAKEEKLIPVASEVDSSEGCDAIDFIVPQNKKVKYFRADSLSGGRESFNIYNYIFSRFERYGWTKNDFFEKAKDNYRDPSVTPDDLLNSSGFGIVIYTGIGGYCDFYPGAIPGHHYVQCCTPYNLSYGQLDNQYNDLLNAVGEDRFKQYITWRDQGRLIYSGFEQYDGKWVNELSMDIELFEDEGKIDPGTIVLFSSVNSWRIKDSFMSKGAGCFIGWDGDASISELINPLTEMLYTMIKSDIPQHISYAYNQLHSALKKSEYGGTLKVDDNGLDVYLPSFGKMIIDIDDPPSGTNYYWISVYPYGFTSKDNSLGYDTWETFEPGEEFEYDGICPVNTIITITSRDTYRAALDSSIEFPIIDSGENPLLTFTDWNTYGIKLEADPSTVESDGTSTSTITATLKTFQEDDVTEPTGTPLPCKQVEFITNFGTFIGESKVWTDNNGQATIKIKSDTDGIATVRAIVSYEGIESYKTQNITFGEVPYSFRLAERRTTQADSSGDIIEVIAWGYYLVFKGKPGVEYYIITKDCDTNSKEYSTDGKLPYEDDYYKDIRILTDEERAEWNTEYDEDGLRFYLFRGTPVATSETSNAWQTTLSEKQEYLYNSLNECTFTIEAYNS